MSIAKAYDVAYVRFDVPDLDRMRTFLLDFGMQVSASDGRELFMRGHGPMPFVHWCQQADAPAFTGFGIWLKSEEDLAALAAHDGVAVEPLDAPGGGKFVRLTDPDGFTVEAVAGFTMVDPLPIPDHQQWNHGGEYPRRAAKRVGQRPSHVRRMGHVVLGVANFRRSEAWYKERFGFVTSDEVQPVPGHAMGAFMRCDRGDEPCDHHTLLLTERPIPPGFMHAAYEVADLDDLMTGHDHLVAAGYDHHWGIGRHFTGSQVFDYWLDPYGHEIEHWTDGDRFVTADGGGIAPMHEVMGVQWGMPMPPMGPSPGAPGGPPGGPGGPPPGMLGAPPPGAPGGPPLGSGR